MSVPDLTTEAVCLTAMSLEVPATKNHPNKRPFTGVLTRLDEPSDGPPGGTGGRRALISKAVGEAMLPTLLGMAIDMAPNISDHKENHKIGIITKADIVGNAIEIGGFFYAKDFPAEMVVIDKQKKLLGFSFELSPTAFTITAENYYRVDAGSFTGAALLLKNKAAYKTTSLAAALNQEIDDMTLEEILASVAALTASVAKQDEAITALTKKLAEEPALKASAECRAAVEPHATALESAAAGMKAAGIGSDPKYGHVAILNSMAGQLRASAALGNLPHVYDQFMRASDDNNEDKVMDKATAEAIAAMKASQEATAKTLGDISAALVTLSADIKAKNTDHTPPPDRKTLPPQITALLDRHGIKAHDEKGDILNNNMLSAAMTKAGVEPEKRLQILVSIDRARKGLSE